MKKFLFSFVVLLLLVATSNLSWGQSKNFKLAKQLEIQYNILSALSSNFVDTIDFEKTINVGISAMLESLDPYTEYVPSEESENIEILTTSSYGGIGAMIRKIDSLGVMIVQPTAGSPAVKYGLEPGDVILTIDGEDVKKLSADECSKKMRGTPGSTVRFKVKKGRDQSIKTIDVVRGKVHTPDITCSTLLRDQNGKVTTDGYIMLSGFTVGGGEDVRKAVQTLKNEGAKRIILDLRGNGGGLLDEAVDVVSAFVPKGTLVVSAKGRGNGSNFSYSTKKDPIDTQIPLMILVNSGSASSSEIVAGAIQDLDRGVIAGTRTFGKGLVQSFRPVGYDGKLKLTISRYYTPSGRCIQMLDYTHRNPDGSVGVVPDSLKKAFKTVGGRTVYDGGGIDPDTTIKATPVSRTIASLVYGAVLDDYAIEYYKKNKTIASPYDFYLTDKEYEDFVSFASKTKIDIRTSVEVALDQMIERAKEEKLYDIDKAEYEALSAKIKLSKEEILRAKKDEIKPFLEAEIAQKYYFTEGGAIVNIRDDSILKTAIESWK